MRYITQSALRSWKKRCHFLSWTLRRFMVPVTSFFLGVFIASCYCSVYFQETYYSQSVHIKSNYDVLLTMNERRTRAKAVCANHTGLTSDPNVAHSLISWRKKLFYCPVEKVASTFWRRFLYQMENTHPVSSPFDVGIRHALTRMRHLMSPNTTNPLLNKVLTSFTTMVFVRDPYSRIFSAFVDKLIAPNPFYWRAWGLKAIVESRELTKAELKSKACGNNVTFPEFVSFVLKYGWSRDVHLMPIFRLCTPCSIRYDIIGKMETFFPDLLRLLELLNIDKDRLHLDRFRYDTINDAIEDAVTDAMSRRWLLRSLRCGSKEEVAKRIWRKLQLRGIISWRQNFWLSPQHVKSLNAPEYIEILKTANKKSRNATELQLQKRQAMLEAFNLLSDVHFHNLHGVYGADFELFQFDLERIKIGGRNRKNKVISTDAFDWTKNWNLAEIV